MTSAIVVPAFAINTDTILHGILYYIPAEIMIISVSFLVAISLLLFIAYRLPLQNNHDLFIDHQNDPTTRPALARGKRGTRREASPDTPK